MRFVLSDKLSMTSHDNLIPALFDMQYFNRTTPDERLQRHGTRMGLQN